MTSRYKLIHATRSARLHVAKFQSSDFYRRHILVILSVIGLSAHFWQIHKLKLKPEIYAWTTSFILFATLNSFLNIFHVDPWTLKTSLSCNIIGRSAKTCHYLHNGSSFLNEPLYVSRSHLDDRI